MSKRKYYKNFNKRKNFNATRGITITLCLCIIGTYAYINIKDKDFMDKFNKINMVSTIKNASIWEGIKKLFSKSDIITSSDISSQLEELEDEDSNNEDESKVASVKEMIIYTIQVASIENQSDLKKIEEVMEEYKIPSASMPIDDAQKIQVYLSLDESKVRENLENTRTYFSDAFLTKLEVPMLSLEYTNSYSYMKNIGDSLNDLIGNFEKESKYWDSGKKNLKTYNEILTNRKTILRNLEENAEKIDYEKMDKFKKNLISLIENVEGDILTSSKSANENKNYISQGLLLSSIQDYYVFVNSMK